MEKKKERVESRKKTTNRVGFGLLYKIFATKIISHFFLLTIAAVLSIYLSFVSSRITGQEEVTHTSSHHCGSNCEHGHVSAHPSIVTSGRDSTHNSSNTGSCEEYEKYLPFWKYHKFFHLPATIGRGQFVTITLLLFSVYLLSSYFSSLLEKEIAAESYFHLRGMLLKKFWRLGLEQKKENTYELKIILENEVEFVSELSEHLPAHFFQSLLIILIVGSNRFLEIKDIGINLSVFFLVMILVYLTIYTIVSDFSIGKYEAYKKMADEELMVVDKQVSNAQLIENMGLTSFHEKLRNEYARKTLFSKKKAGKGLSLLAIVISSLGYYRYLSPLFAGRSVLLRTVLSNINPLFFISDSLKDILDCYKEYDRYKIACSRIDNFLNIQEREENLEKRSIVNLSVKEITLANVDFKYSSSEQLVLTNYSRSFLRGAVNEVVSGNGSGKTTILYLILGIIKPLNGEVLVKFSNGETMNLHKEINLYEWREKMTLYLSHDNLISDGSTGQKQLENISKNLSQRKDSQIFIFDEATNALDSERQKFIAKELKKMINKNKIIILVQHKTNPANG